MTEIEALNKGEFSFEENEGEYINISHCGEKSEVLGLFPGINTVTCKKCGMRLVQKELIGECFLNN